MLAILVLATLVGFTVFVGFGVFVFVGVVVVEPVLVTTVVSEPNSQIISPGAQFDFVLVVEVVVLVQVEPVAAFTAEIAKADTIAITKIERIFLIEL